MAISVETQAKAKETYSELVSAVIRFGALCAGNDFIASAVCRVGSFDASASVVEKGVWVGSRSKVAELMSGYTTLSERVMAFESHWASCVAIGDEGEALAFLSDVSDAVAYAWGRV